MEEFNIAAAIQCRPWIIGHDPWLHVVGVSGQGLVVGERGASRCISSRQTNLDTRCSLLALTHNRERSQPLICTSPVVSQDRCSFPPTANDVLSFQPSRYLFISTPNDPAPQSCPVGRCLVASVHTWMYTCNTCTYLTAQRLRMWKGPSVGDLRTLDRCHRVLVCS